MPIYESRCEEYSERFELLVRSRDQETKRNAPPHI